MSDFLYDYFTFNSLYSSEASRVNIRTVVNAIVTFTDTFVCILAFLVQAFKISKHDRRTFELDVIYGIFMVAGVLLVTMSGQTYSKMEIAMIPLFIYPFSSLFDLFKGIDGVTTIMIGYLIITSIYPSWSAQFTKAASDINTYVNNPDRKGMQNDTIVKYIKDNSSESDTISVFGNRCVYYLYSNREPSSRYIFLPDPRVDKSIIEGYFEDIKNTLPKIIVVYTEYTGDREWVTSEMLAFLEKYHYELVMEGDHPVYRRN